MDDGPEFQRVLKLCGGQDLANKFRSELVFRTTLQGGQTKLGVRVDGWFLENALFGMEKLNEWKVVGCHSWMRAIFALINRIC